MNKIIEQKQQTKYNNHLVLGFLLSGAISVLSSYIGTRYPTTTFCFKPEYSIKTKYCQDSQQYEALSSYFEDSNYRLGNDQYSREYRAILPKVTRLSYHKPQNPNAPLQAIVGAVLVGIATTLYSTRTKQTLATFPAYYEEYKTNCNEIYFEEKQSRDVASYKSKAETNYITDNLVKDDQQQRAEDMNDGERLHIIKQAERQENIEVSQYELLLAEIKEAIARKDLDRARSEQEIRKCSIESKDKTTASTENDLKKELTELLKSHEGGWLWDIAAGTMAVIIYGKPGSYKSYTAACMALIKHAIQDATLISICDPHAHQNAIASWKDLMRLNPVVYGANKDWEGYSKGIAEALNRWAKRTLNDKALVSIWDELTTMQVCLPDVAPQFMPEIIAAPRKANENVILLTHSITQKGLGNVTGMSDAIKDSCLRLKLKGTAQNKPLFKGMINGWVDAEGEEIEDYPITIPDWLRPENLVKYCK